MPDVVDTLLDIFNAPSPAAADVAVDNAQAIASLSASTPGETATVTPSGEHFVEWLRQNIETRHLIVNDAKALVHTVAGTASLVSPGIFQRYAQEHPEIGRSAKQEQLSEWAWVQKRFERLGVHRKQNDGLNIWTCEVTGPRKSRQLHG